MTDILKRGRHGFISGSAHPFKKILGGKGHHAQLSQVPSGMPQLRAIGHTIHDAQAQRYMHGMRHDGHQYPMDRMHRPAMISPGESIGQRLRGHFKSAIDRAYGKPNQEEQMMDRLGRGHNGMQPILSFGNDLAQAENDQEMKNTGAQQ